MAKASKAAQKSGALFAAPEAASPPPRHVVAHIDGGARGNPGPSAYGVVIEDQKRHRLAELSKFLGAHTNNHAEYCGLIAALEYAQQYHHAALRVVSDSELLVKQMRGEYKVKSPELRPLYDQARKLSAGLKWFSIEHVPREKNRVADRLANQAINRATGKQAPTGAGKTMGVVRNGVVELEGELPEGARVWVRVMR